MPEHLPRGTDEHEPYDELCALAAGGLVEGSELVDFRTHMKDCNKCRAEYQELSDLVTRELPQAQGKFRQRLTVMRAQPLAYSRQRFLRRARAEGVVFSPEVDSSAPSRPWYLRPVTILAPITALVVVVGSLTVYHFRETPETARATDSAAAQQIAELKQENSVLAASLSRLSESVAQGQREIQNLHAQLGTENPRRNNQQAAEAERSSSRDAQLLDESRNQEKLLADAKDEAARINQLHLNDEASLVEQQTRITELSDKLRIASATLDQERHLAAAGKDIRELMAARQLHVIDVRDTDSNGKPGNAFGRVFLTEGKSLTFYAFDLNNEDRVENAKRSFQVWAVLDKTGSARSLGLLHVDAKAQGRWVLKVDNPELVKEINAVFITANPVAGGTEPSGQKMLYAYLGEPNHP